MKFDKRTCIEVTKGTHEKMTHHYYQGMLHRTDGPAVIFENLKTKKSTYQYFLFDGPYREFHQWIDDLIYWKLKTKQEALMIYLKWANHNNQ
jgi:hypothetical protein